jgi:hypothetical protein
LLAGDIEDAFIYRSTLVCWTFDETVILINVQDLEQLLERELGVLGGAAAHLLFHSFGVGAREQQASAWRVVKDSPEFETMTQPVIKLRLDQLPRISQPVRLDANDLLDLLIYWDTLYLATDTGLYSAPFTHEHPEWLLAPRRRMRFPCYSAAASLGSVAASCADYGLRVVFDVEHSLAPLDRPRSRVLADLSVRAEYVGSGLLNYTSHSEFQAFNGSLTEQRQDRTSQRLLSGLRKSHLDTEQVLARLSEDDHGQWDLVFSLRSRLYVLSNGLARSITLRNQKGELTPLGRFRSVATYDGEPLSATTVHRSLLIETADAVLALGVSGEHSIRDGMNELPTGPVVALRSFPRSHRYRNLAVATAESGLWLIGIPPPTREDTDVADS